MDKEDIAGCLDYRNMSHLGENQHLSQSLPVMASPLHDQLSSNDTERRNTLDFFSEGPPPYDETVENNTEANFASKRRHKELYPFKDLRKISNRGLLRSTRINENQSSSSYLQESLDRDEKVEKSSPQNSASAIVTPKMIIEELVKEPECRTLLDSLSYALGEDIDDLSHLVGSNPLLFAMSQDSGILANDSVFVELKPQFDFCEKHSRKRNCKGNCKKLHVCIDYLKRHCENGVECSHGHDLKTNHNYVILSSLHLEDLEQDTLQEVMSRGIKSSLPPSICCWYNEGSCIYDLDCYDLHICYNYARNQGRCSSGDLCPLNHNIFDDQCTKIFENVGILAFQSREKDLFQMIVTNTSKYNKVPNHQNTNKLENDFNNLDISQSEVDESDSSNETEPGDFDLTGHTSQGVVKEENDLNFNCKIISPGALEEEQIVVDSAGGEAQSNETTAVWRKRRKHAARNGMLVKASHRGEKPNSPDRRHSRQLRREIKKQKKIERMERKLKRIQSKIDHLRDGNDSRRDSLQQ